MLGPRKESTSGISIVAREVSCWLRRCVWGRNSLEQIAVTQEMERRSDSCASSEFRSEVNRAYEGALAVDRESYFRRRTLCPVLMHASARSVYRISWTLVLLSIALSVKQRGCMTIPHVHDCSRSSTQNFI